MYRVTFLSLVLLAAVACGGSSPTAPSGPSVVSVAVRSDTGATGIQFNNNPALPAQSTVTLVATAQFSDGTSRVVTTEASWASSNSGLATVSAGTVTVNRRVNGPATITATFRGTNGTFQIPVAAL